MRWQFSSGFAAGIVLATLAMWGEANRVPGDIASLSLWLQLNLGHSIWFFSVVAVLFVFTLLKLRTLLNRCPSETIEGVQIPSLDQMLDVWTQVFIGIGVIWTAVGMRAALQFALGEPDTALADSADNVLRKLVDGGILLALTTTIVGAVGGYLMRLCKTITLGPALQQFYERLERQDIAELIAAAARIEQQLKPATDTPTHSPNVTDIAR